MGFLMGAIIGITFASLISHSKHLERGFYPIIVFFQAIPKSALCPLFIVWFGYGFAPKAMVTFLITFFPILTNTYTGLTIIEPEMSDMMNSLKASKWQIYRKIRLPKSMPYIFTAFKISAPLSVVAAVVAEFIAGESGLGYLVQLSVYHMDMALLFSCLILMAAIGIGMFSVVSISERLALPWYKK